MIKTTGICEWMFALHSSIPPSAWWDVSYSRMWMFLSFNFDRESIPSSGMKILRKLWATFSTVMTGKDWKARSTRRVVSTDRQKYFCKTGQPLSETFPLNKRDLLAYQNAAFLMVFCRENYRKSQLQLLHWALASPSNAMKMVWTEIFLGSFITANSRVHLIETFAPKFRWPVLWSNFQTPMCHTGVIEPYFQDSQSDSFTE